MLYYFKKHKNTTETKDLCSVWRRCWDWPNVSTWFVRFPAGDFSLDGASWSGRPVGADSDQIETLIETNQCYTTRNIPDILKIFKSIKLLVKMKNVPFILQKKPYRFLANPI